MTRIRQRSYSGRLILPILLFAFFMPVMARAAETVDVPFRGVRHIHRTETAPRLLDMHIIDINLADPAIRFRITPPNGPAVPGETSVATTRDFLTSCGAQLAINASFFDHVGPPTVDNFGLAVDAGEPYSTFQDEMPALNIGRDKKATIVTHDPADPTGYGPLPKVDLYNAVSGNERILLHGQNVAHDTNLHPRTAVGLTSDSRLLLFIVDGRNPGHSLGMTTIEEAGILHEYGAVEAINLDGGGSSTLVFADPRPRVVNVPVGLKNVPGTERPVGINLAVYAAPAGSEIVRQPSAGAASAGDGKRHGLFRMGQGFRRIIHRIF